MTAENTSRHPYSERAGQSLAFLIFTRWLSRQTPTACAGNAGLEAKPDQTQDRPAPSLGQAQGVSIEQGGPRRPRPHAPRQNAALRDLWIAPAERCAPRHLRSIRHEEGQRLRGHSALQRSPPKRPRGDPQWQGVMGGKAWARSRLSAFGQAVAL